MALKSLTHLNCSGIKAMELTLKRIENYWGIYDNDLLEYYCKRTSNYFTTFFKRQITLFDTNNTIIAIFETIFFSFSTHIKFISSKNNYKIKYHSILYKPYITAYIEGDYYKIIIHKQPLYSIFKNNFQIGCLKEKTIYNFSKEEIKLTFNTNENIIILFSIIASTILNFNDTNEAINYKHSNTLSELCAFDFDWKENN
jgi:hypothetical protein